MAIVRDYRALISGASWSGDGARNTPVFVTFSFETQVQDYLSDHGFSDAFARSFKAFGAREKATALKALDLWGATSGIRFLEVEAGKGDIKFGNYDFDKEPSYADFAGFAYYPEVSIATHSASVSDIGGDVFMDRRTTIYSADDYLHIILHEIGHAIGLKHPHEGDPTLARDLDHGGRTVMTYNDYEGRLGTFDGIAARALYGAAGSDGGHLARWSWDAATDTLTQIGKASNDTIAGVSTADVITGLAGSDILFGAAGEDSLEGGSGNDSLHGGEGSDRLAGGGGNDRLSGGDPDDRGTDTADYGAAAKAITVDLNGDSVDKDGQAITFHARGPGIGTDTLHEIEAVIGGRGGDTITGDDGDNRLEGRDGGDALFGGSGRDVLDGGSGRDTLDGGANLDTFVFSTRLTNGNVDAIAGFLAGRETIALAGGVFAALSLGALSEAAFRIGPEAAGSGDRIIYDDATGALSYDADGVGGRAQVQFAQLEIGLDLGARDFEIV